MKINKIKNNKTYLASGILFVVAILVFVITALTNRGDMTSAVLVLCGFMLLVTAVFILITAERAPLPASLSELLPMQGTVNLARAFADLGVTSDTIHRFNPETKEVMQINPVTGGQIPELTSDTTFVTVGDWNGISYPALAMPLLRKLKSVDHLSVPENNTDMLETCLREVFTDYLSIAEKLTLAKNDKSIVVTLEKFQPISLCKSMKEVSSKCCTMVSCPMCSLVASIIAESERQDVLFDSSVVEGTTLTLVFSLYQTSSAQVSSSKTSDEKYKKEQDEN